MIAEVAEVQEEELPGEEDEVTANETLSAPERQDRLGTDLQLDHLESGRKERLLDTLRRYHQAFALEKNEIGCTDKVQHEIDLEPGSTPHKERYRTIPAHLLDEVRRHLDELMETGAITPSESPWCNAVVLVRKKNGELRFCIDFRKLNKKTKKDAYPLPRINDALNAMGGSKFFSCLDLKRGFYQAEMAEDSRPLTAFTVGNLGFYEFRKMPFGLCNAPATFQRLMQNCLGELNYTICVVYLDDIIVFADTEEEHLRRIALVLQRLMNAKLKLKPGKCEFFKTEIEYLGHKLTANGILPCQRNLEKVAQMGEPRTVTEVKSFLGLASHYRRFIKGFAKIASPMNAYTTKEMNPSGKKGRQSPEVTLDEKAREAFLKLKNLLVDPPVLVYADITKPFRLETDASKIALGAVLTQEANGAHHPVAYASRLLQGPEVRYHSSKQEFLAFKWAVVEQFPQFLICKPFTVRTDNNPLTYVTTTPNLDATGHRWMAALASFNFSLEYLKGTKNGAADALSRDPQDNILSPAETEAFLKEKQAGILDPQAREYEVVPAPEVRAMMEAARDGSPDRIELLEPHFEEELQKREALSQTDVEATRVELDDSPPEKKPDLSIDTNRAVTAPVGSKVIEREWAELQREDVYLDAVIRWIESGKAENLRNYLDDGDPALDPVKPKAQPAGDPKGKGDKEEKPVPRRADPEGRGIRQVQKLFVMFKDLLYKRHPGGDPTTDDHLQFVIPKMRRKMAIDGCHREAAHQGQDRTLAIASERFWWPGMKTDIVEAVRNCHTCKTYNAPPQKAALESITATRPLELIHTDFTSIETNPNVKEQTKTRSVLVITDHFTRHAMAFVTPDQKARTVAEVLWESYFSVFGIPDNMITDQGKNFTSEVIQTLMDIFGIKKVQTSAYHPETNGQCERMNQTIFHGLAKLPEAARVEWAKHIHVVTHAYNCTRSAVTGYSPYYLMFGRRPRMPVDLYFPTRNRETTKRVASVRQYATDLEQRLRQALTLARANARQEAARQKRYYDRAANATQLLPGDRVMTRVNQYVGRRKTNSRWDGLFHTVIGPLNATTEAVFRVEHPVTGVVKVFHRNRLLKVNNMPEEAQAIAAEAAVEWTRLFPGVGDDGTEDAVRNEERNVLLGTLPDEIDTKLGSESPGAETEAK